MFRAVIAAASVLMLAPLASAQTPGPQDQPAYQRLQLDFQGEPEKEPSSFYGSLGLAWSGELGIELEIGAQAQIGDFLQLRFSPLNFSLFDGDVRYEDSSSYDYYADDCADQFEDDEFGFDYFCYREPDSEWRSVAEATLKLGPGFYIGGGAAYLMQGDFDPDRGRVESFMTFGARVDAESLLELRIGEDYSALRVVGVW